MWNEKNEVIVSFDKVCFAYDDGNHVILNEADFSIRENTKITIMWQNGAGKSTIFKLLMWEEKPQKWKINVNKNSSIAISRQVVARDMLDMTVREYFATAFTELDYQLDRKIENVLKEVNFTAPIDKKMRDYSWGQQARLLLAHALIQDPDILLLDEPTNNLDADGIWDLIWFLLTYLKTVIVISHDADFLNMFTEWVLYLNKVTQKVEQYWGDYYDVLERIAAQIEKEKAQNARAEKQIQDAKEKVNFFSNKWWKMRKLASKMRESIQEAEENKVTVRRDDRTIRPFDFEFENYVGPMVTINNITLMDKNHNLVSHPLPLEIKRKDKYILKWPNGIGKSTLLKRLVHANDKDAIISWDVRVGYYSQDFNALDFNMTVWDSLHAMSDEVTNEEVYAIAAHFLLTWNLLKSKIWSLSEWQKWLLCYARFIIQSPHLLILDEPTNHINFRHLPAIAEAINDFKWAVIMVCHDEWFVSKLKDFQEIDLWGLI